MRPPPRPIPWLIQGEPFPPVSSAWGGQAPAPGLLAAGGGLDVASLVDAYSQGIFPWFSLGQPILWWSPDPRMVLKTENFKLHHSLKKTLKALIRSDRLRISFDEAFNQVIRACADKPRQGQAGTWIVPDMVSAYEALHRAGHAHSVETWIDGELAGGLYCINLGRMVFGESMFAHRTDASKIALAGLVAFCRAHGMPLIDCQQNTGHLASLGAAEIERSAFAAQIEQVAHLAAPKWQFNSLYWSQLPGII